MSQMNVALVVYPGVELMNAVTAMHTNTRYSYG
jgi:hypothetical protein